MYFFLFFLVQPLIKTSAASNHCSNRCFSPAITSTSLMSVSHVSSTTGSYYTHYAIGFM